MATFCVIDDHKISLMTGKVQLSDKSFICTPHWKQLGFNSVTDLTYAQKLDSNSAKEAFENSKNLKTKFVEEKNENKENSKNKINEIKSYNGFKSVNGIWVSPEQRILFYPGNRSNSYEDKTVSFSDFVEYSPEIEGDEKVKKHGIARAITGGVLAGPAGAVVGAVTGGKKMKYVTRMALEIKDKNMDRYTVEFINTQTKTGGLIYSAASVQMEQTATAIDKAMQEAAQSVEDEQPANSNSEVSVADELIKLKSLLDAGVLTQEEFDEQKDKLLN